MWRVVTPLVLLVVAGVVYQEGHDDDAEYYVFPMVEQLPGVSDTPTGRADASAGLLALVGLLVGAMNLARGSGRDPDQARED